MISGEYVLLLRIIFSATFIHRIFSQLRSNRQKQRICSANSMRYGELNSYYLSQSHIHPVSPNYPLGTSLASTYLLTT